MVLGLIVAILPCAITKRVLVGPIIIGVISISIAIFCIVDYVLFVKNRRNIRCDKSEVDKDNIKEGKKSSLPSLLCNKKPSKNRRLF